jgi:hypothetical protein
LPALDPPNPEPDEWDASTVGQDPFAPDTTKGEGPEDHHGYLLVQGGAGGSPELLQSNPAAGPLPKPTATETDETETEAEVPRRLHFNRLAQERQSVLSTIMFPPPPGFDGSGEEELEAAPGAAEEAEPASGDAPPRASAEDPRVQAGFGLEDAPLGKRRRVQPLVVYDEPEVISERPPSRWSRLAEWLRLRRGRPPPPAHRRGETAASAPSPSHGILSPVAIDLDALEAAPLATARAVPGGGNEDLASTQFSSFCPSQPTLPRDEAADSLHPLRMAYVACHLGALMRNGHSWSASWLLLCPSFLSGTGKAGVGTWLHAEWW